MVWRLGVHRESSHLDAKLRLSGSYMQIFTEYKNKTVCENTALFLHMFCCLKATLGSDPCLFSPCCRDRLSDSSLSGHRSWTAVLTARPADPSAQKVTQWMVGGRTAGERMTDPFDSLSLSYFLSHYLCALVELYPTWEYASRVHKYIFALFSSLCKS